MSRQTITRSVLQTSIKIPHRSSITYTLPKNKNTLLPHIHSSVASSLSNYFVRGFATDNVLEENLHASTSVPVDIVKPTSNVRRRAELGQVTFEELGVSSALVGILEKFHIRNPSSIQKLTIGHLIRKFDGRANKLYIPPNVAIQDYTGSGKTLSYILPIMQNIDTTVDMRIPPSDVIAMTNHLRGINVANPPSEAITVGMKDEYEKPKVIMYDQDDVYQGNVKTSELEEPDVNEDIQEWLNSLEINIDELSEEEWKQLVLKHAEVALPNTAPVNLLPRLREQMQQANMVSNSQFTVHAQRLRKKMKLLQKLKTIFPTLDENILSPDNPQSRLQCIIVVPTKELVMQVTSALNELNPTTFVSQHQDFRTQAIGGKRNQGVKKSRIGIEVRPVSGPITPKLLNSLGIYSVPNEQELEEQQDYSTKDDNMEYMRVHGKRAQPPPPAKHPFVTFGKGHPLYREDQDQIRANTIEDEKLRTLRRIRDRERDLELKKLSQITDVYDNSVYNSAVDPEHDNLLDEPEYDDDDDEEMEFDDNDYNTSRTMKKNKQQPLPPHMMFDKSASEAVFDPPPALYNYLRAKETDHIERDKSKQPHILVGTPTTIAELIKCGAITLPSPVMNTNQLKYLVFDEIDHLARNEKDYAHTSVLELMSIPCDQMIFVSASMTRENALLMTRLARRHKLPYLNILDTQTSYTGMLNLPRPGYAQPSEEDIEQIFIEAQEYADAQWKTYEEHIMKHGLEPVFNRKGEIIEVDMETKLEKAKRKIYNKALTPYLLQKDLAELPQYGNWNNLPIASCASEVGEVLFLTPEDYRPSANTTDQQYSGSGNGKSGTSDVKPETFMPLAPYLRHYIVDVPANTDKFDLLLDLLCQLKVKARKGINDTLQAATASSASGSGTTGAPHSAASKGESTFLDSTNSDLTNLLNPNANALASGNTNTNTNTRDSSTTNTTNTTDSNSTSNTSKVLTASHTRSISSKELCPGNILIFYGQESSHRMKQLKSLLESVDLRVGIYDTTVSRKERSDVLNYNPDMDVVIANDTLARGMDMHAFSLVINLDIPRSIPTYLHRAGRVGRLGSPFRRKSMVVNLVKEQGTRKEDHKNIMKHVKYLQLPMKPWPYKIAHNIHQTMMKTYKEVKSQEMKKLNAQRKVFELNKGTKKKGLEVKDSGVIIPTPARLHKDTSTRKNKGRQSAADSQSWVSWDSNSKTWR